MIELVVALAKSVPYDVWLGCVSGLVSYLFDFQKARRDEEKFDFRPTSLAINGAMGAFVAYLLGTIIAENVAGREALLAVSGLTAYNIILILQSQGAGVIAEKILGGKIKKDTDADKKSNN